MPEDVWKGRAILVVEDEYLIAMDLRKQLLRAGATVVGPAASVEKTIDLVESTPRLDGAILDINLSGEMVFPAADLLRERAVPFLFTTGYDQSAIPPRFADVPRCEKPIGFDELGQRLATLLSPRV